MKLGLPDASKIAPITNGPQRVVLLIGSTSSISMWIKSFYDENNIKTIELSRNPRSDYSYGSIKDVDRLRNIFSEIQEAGQSIDTIYYCPGYLALSPVASIAMSEWLKAFDVNLHGFLGVYQAVCDVLNPSSLIKLIVIGSTAVVSNPKHNAAYVCAKQALETLVRYINNELPESIRACCIRLGSCDTDFADNRHREVLIGQKDLVCVSSLIHSIRPELLPDSITIRPICRL